ncbi:MAG: antirestriction protein [Rubrivivax sp.]|nr:antirestriction protein [Rubrivivax sp.]
MTIANSAAAGPNSAAASLTSPAATEGVVAGLVPDSARLGFLPKHFGSRRYLRGEIAVYNWMGALCPDYRGGYWEFLELSNGSFYMRPADCPPRAAPPGCPTGASAAARPHRMLVRVESNGFEGDVSADAAGIIATLFALNYLVCGGAEELTDKYYALREFALRHPESASILGAID